MAPDAQLRQAAFDCVNRLAALKGGILDSADLSGGFDFSGDRIPLVNPQRGIFKPRQMAHLLSIKTVFPRRGARVWYDDQREAHRQIYAGDEVVDYASMGTDPNSPDNRWLRCSSRPRSSISSARRRVAISPSSRHSSWAGILSAYGFSLPSEPF
jgi:putative restriction endonuclease